MIQKHLNTINENFFIIQINLFHAFSIFNLTHFLFSRIFPSSFVLVLAKLDILNFHELAITSSFNFWYRRPWLYAANSKKIAHNKFNVTRPDQQQFDKIIWYTASILHIRIIGDFLTAYNEGGPYNIRRNDAYLTQRLA